MNPRRVHEVMREKFPAYDAAEHEWTNILESDGPNQARLGALVRQHFDDGELVIEVHRKLGALLPADEIVEYVCAHIGEGDIRIANREFTSFVVVARNGVATGWTLPSGNLETASSAADVSQ